MRFDVLSRELNVFEPHFLEASAGTGKTFAIEHLVTRLLIEGDAPLKIEEILVVTFTRAATRELKLRIRRALVRAKEELDGENPAWDYLKAICERGENKEAQERIEAALICFDAAQIYTLHGFCHRLLNEYAFEAGIGLEVADPDEKRPLGLLEQVVKDHLKDSVAFPDYSPMQIKAVLNRYQSEPRKMVSSLVDVVSGNTEISAMPKYGALLETFHKEMQSLPEIDAGLFKADVVQLIAQYKKMTGMEGQVDLLCAILEKRSCTVAQFEELLKEESFLARMSSDNLKVRAKEVEKLHYPGLIERVQKFLLPLLDKAGSATQIFLRLAQDIREKSQALLEKNETFSPDVLLLKVQKALEQPQFVARVRENYRAAIIDEFQDTDPIQWEIFQQLFVSHLKAVCLVGDPKQSIYAFRNADVYTYLSAAEVLGTSAKKYLDTNYRSTTPLVEALNALFAKAKSGWMDLPGAKQGLDVLPVKAGAKITNESTEAPIQFFIAQGKKGRHKKFPTTEMLEGQILPFIAREIGALSERGIAYHDIVILIKDRFQARAVVDFLKTCKIPANFKRGASITDSAAYFAMKELLSAVCAPYDLSKIKVALGSPLIAWQDVELSRPLVDPHLLAAKAQMQALNHLLLQKGLGAFFQTFLNTKWGGKDPVLQGLLSRGELTLYLELRKLMELLVEEERLQGLVGEGLVAYLEEIALEADREESRLRTPSPEEQGSVKIMTIHMSKGLEFEVVFALGLASRHKPSEQMTVKSDGRVVLTTFNEADPACQRAIEELDAEKMRQLYVACTRAKQRLYLPLMLDDEQKPLQMGEAAPMELFLTKFEAPFTKIFEELRPHVSYRFLEASAAVIHSENSTCQLIAPPALHLPIYDQPLLSFSAIAKKEHSAEVISLPATAVLSPHTLPLGSETGNWLHMLLEKIFKRGLHHPLNELALAKLIDETIAFSPLEKWQPIILPWVMDLLTKPLLLNFALCDLPSEQLQQEMEFLFPLQRGVMKGFADLFFEWEGKYYLLDWKSNYLGASDQDYTLEKIERVMQHNQYDLQASIYAEALKRYVKLFDTRPFSESFGGAFYYFIRGKAVHHFFPNPWVANS